MQLKFEDLNLYLFFSWQTLIQIFDWDDPQHQGPILSYSSFCFMAAFANNAATKWASKASSIKQYSLLQLNSGVLCIKVITRDMLNKIQKTVKNINIHIHT